MYSVVLARVLDAQMKRFRVGIHEQDVQTLTCSLMDKSLCRMRK